MSLMKKMDDIRYCPICDKIISEFYWHHCPHDVHKWRTDSKFGDSQEVVSFNLIDIARLLYKEKISAIQRGIIKESNQ